MRLPLLLLGMTVCVAGSVIPASATNSCPPPPWAYCNGPTQGPHDGTIHDSLVSANHKVTDSFEFTSSYDNVGFVAWFWVDIGAKPLTADWAIHDAPDGGNYFGKGTVNLEVTFMFTNDFGYDVYEVSAPGLLHINQGLQPGEYWLTLENAKSSDQGLVGWEENDGKGCQSQGCPSQAFNEQGEIGSEAFLITGDSVPEPASIVLLGTGALSIVGRTRRRS